MGGFTGSGKIKLKIRELPSVEIKTLLLSFCLQA